MKYPLTDTGSGLEQADTVNFSGKSYLRLLIVVNNPVLSILAIAMFFQLSLLGFSVAS